MDYIIPIGIGICIPWISKFLYTKFEQFNELRSLVVSENPSLKDNSFRGFIDSSVKVFRILKTSGEVMFYQKFYSPSKVHLENYFGHKTLCPLFDNPKPDVKSSKFVDIYYNMEWYKVPFEIKKGPVYREITQIKDESGCDITYEILPFAGPLHNFFNTEISPHFFGLTKMTISCDGEEYIFKDFDKIIFSYENLVTKDIEQTEIPINSSCNEEL